MRLTALHPFTTHTARRLIAASGLFLLPWAAMLWNTLPSTAHVRHWSAAWIGLDLFLAAGCGLTTMLLRRNDSRARLVASAVAGAAVIDLWFDLITAEPGAQFAQAVLCALAETALIAACLRIALAPDEAPAREWRIAA
ncbi:hypothetical protein DFR70_105223 [Nocardia tenerifensis]|uniref:LPXTG-motif cell wall-anchored protein n=1 Tax=Nocardia tenerifensis TaxID=228006 RepID=A0A318KDI6_9NOCA|nr:hypothetical protein [Nocardia tenerifensis]PXX64041.1 hypothetical protein DFR70_105223 [Nocardia tenerifensis]